MANQVETIIQVQYENRDRKSAFFRLVFALPVSIYLATLVQAAHWGVSSVTIVLPVVLALVFRGVYPSWILNFNHAVFEFANRVTAYALLLTDKHPTFEGNPTVAVLFPDVEGGKKLNRWLPIVKWILAIPLYIVGLVYTVYALLALLILWLEISVTGKSSAWSLDIIYKVVKYWNRVAGYAVLLLTDDYPAFTLS